jgi:hypothetical protein
VTHAIAEAELDQGSALEALLRLLDSAWLALDRFGGLARASGEELPPAARRDAHREVLDVVDGVVARGQAEGSLRTDVPAAWLTSVFYGLIHTAVDDVNAGRLSADAARAALGVTLRDALG